VWAFQDVDGCHVAWLSGKEFHTASYKVYCFNATGDVIDWIDVPHTTKPMNFYDVSVPTAQSFRVAEIDERTNAIETVSHSVALSQAVPKLVASLRQDGNSRKLSLSQQPLPSYSGAIRVFATPAVQAGGGADFIIYSSRATFISAAQPLLDELQAWGYELDAWASDSDPDPMIARQVAMDARNHNVNINHPRLPTLVILGSSYESVSDLRNVVGTIYYPDSGGECVLGTCASDAKIVDFDGDDVPDIPWTRVLARSTTDIARAATAALRYRRFEGLAPQRAVILDGDVRNNPQSSSALCQQEAQPRAALEAIKQQLTSHNIETVMYNESGYPCRDWSAHKAAMIAAFSGGMTELVGSGMASNSRYMPGGFIQQVYDPVFDLADVPFPQLFVAEMFACSSADEDQVNALDPLLVEQFSTGDPNAGPVAVAWLGNRRGGYVWDHMTLAQRYFEDRFSETRDCSLPEVYLNTLRALSTEKPNLKSYLVLSCAFGWPVTLPDMSRPAFIASPSAEEEISDVAQVTATVNPYAYSYAADLDSFTVQWGAGTSPTVWHTYGISYPRPLTSPAQRAVVANWNTGVVRHGDYTVRLVSHLGSQTFEVRRPVKVRHRSTIVATTGGSYTSLQAAMNWAEMGDTIRVMPGIYPNTQASPTLFLKPTVHVVAVGPGVEIQPYGENPIMKIPQVDFPLSPWHTYPARLKGLKLKRASPSSGASSHGLKISGSAVVVENCSFQGMQAESGSAVFAAGQANVVLTGCVFDGSNRSGTTEGSVICFVANSDQKPTGAIVDCVFEDNSVRPCEVEYDPQHPLQGTEPKPYFQRCRFENNQAEVGVVVVRNSIRTINFTTCSFLDNTIYPGYGVMGVIECDHAKVLIDHCTIANNREGNPVSYDAVGAVGVFDLSGALPVTIVDSIIAFNSGPVIHMNGGMISPGNMTLERTIVYGNEAFQQSRSDVQWASTGTNVFVENPAFVNAGAGDYRVYAFSRAAAVANGENESLHFAGTVGAYDHIVVPTATVTVEFGDNVINPPGAALLGCPQGEVGTDHMDHLIITATFNSGVVTRPLLADELSIQPPYLATGINSSTKIHATASTGYTLTLDHPYLSGFGTNDQLTLYLDGYALVEKASFVHRSFDMKSAGAPGPSPCGLDISCPDGMVTNPDFNWFASHYPTVANPGATYFEAADYAKPFSSPIGFPDYSRFVGHFVGAGHAYPYTGELQTVGDKETTASTHVVLGFTEEFVTALEHKLYVDVTLEDCADKNWCVFSLRPNRSDLSLSSWIPTDWAASSAPFVPLNIDNEQELSFGVIMINDTEESTRLLGRLVFNVAGSDPVTVSNDQFMLTFGELALAQTSQGGQNFVVQQHPVFAHMSRVSGRQLTAGVQQVFHNSLEQNFPNPFNPQTAIAYSLKDAADVRLAIYDVAGRRVRELVDEHRMPGAYKVIWDGRDGKGSQVSSGVYFCKLVAGSFVETKKMVMLK
jgi:hypothetical protein